MSGLFGGWMRLALLDRHDGPEWFVTDLNCPDDQERSTEALHRHESEVLWVSAAAVARWLKGRPTTYLEVRFVDLTEAQRRYLHQSAEVPNNRRYTGRCRPPVEKLQKYGLVSYEWEPIGGPSSRAERWTVTITDAGRKVLMGGAHCYDQIDAIEGGTS